MTVNRPVTVLSYFTKLLYTSQKQSSLTITPSVAVQYINDLSQQLDLNEVLGNAESLFHNIRSQPDIPFNIRSHILRLVDSTMSSMDSAQNNQTEEIGDISQDGSRDLLDMSRDMSRDIAQGTEPEQDPASLLVENRQSLSNFNLI